MQTKKKYLLAAVAALALGGSAFAATADTYYQARAQEGGMLLRAGWVCANPNDKRTPYGTSDSFLEAGLARLGDDMAPVTNAYPDKVKAWAKQGGDSFDKIVMTQGYDTACRAAVLFKTQKRFALIPVH